MDLNWANPFREARTFDWRASAEKETDPRCPKSSPGTEIKVTPGLILDCLVGGVKSLPTWTHWRILNNLNVQIRKYFDVFLPQFLDNHSTKLGEHPRSNVQSKEHRLGLVGLIPYFEAQQVLKFGKCTAPENIHECPHQYVNTRTCECQYKFQQLCSI